MMTPFPAAEARTTLEELASALEASGAPTDETVGLDDVAARLCAVAHLASSAGLARLSDTARCAAEAVACLLEAGAGPASAGFSRIAEVTRQMLAFLSQIEHTEAGGDVDLKTWTDRLVDAADAARAVAAEAREAAAVPAAPPPAVASLRDDVDPDPPPGVPPELAEIFGIEAHDHLEVIATAVASVAAGGEPRQGLLALRRSVHTLKGAAGMVGFRAVSRLAHRMEDLLDGLCEGETALSPDTLHLLVHTGDLLQDLIDGVGNREARRSAIVRLHEEYDRVLGSPTAAAPPVRAGVPSGRASAPPDTHAEANATGRAIRQQRVDQTPVRPPTAPGMAAVPDAERTRRPLRVSLDRLDGLVREVGELLVSRSGIEQRLRGLSAQAGEMALAVERLHRIATRLETEYEVMTLGGNLDRRFGRHGGDHSRPVSAHDFDELELDRYTDFHLITRELIETSTDLSTIGRHVTDAVAELDGRFDGLGQIAATLQDDLMAVRLVPLATIAGRLERTVRRAAEQQGKRVDFVLKGGEHTIDTGVIDQIVDALLHLLRNAVDHGIEPPDVREAKGRPPQGRVTVAASRHGSQIVIRVEDDGTGIDYARLRERAIEGGFMSAAAAASNQALEALMFLPGFSTRTRVSEISGRGIGLDVVQTSVRALDGRVGVESAAGGGTIFTLRLPLTLAIVRSLLVRVDERLYAIPQASIREVRRMARHDVDARDCVEIGDGSCRRVFLADVLGLPRHPLAVAEGVPGGSAEAVTVLAIDVDGEPVALVVDGFTDMRDLVVKPLPAHVRRVGGIAGASVLGDGRVVLILNPEDLLRRPVAAPAVTVTQVSEAGRRVVTVLIVDDSVSVRRVLAGVVEGAGWRSIQARDGLEALEYLQRVDEPPDLILLDIEMPRLDGFELTQVLRSQDAYRDVPIVVISSRANEKHRERAAALGATEYLVKPFLEDTLLAVMRRLTMGREGAAA